MKTAIRPCPICDNRSVDVLNHQKFVLPADHILPDAFDVVWCPSCGFAYADSPMGQEDYDRYYSAFSKYEDNETSTGGGGSKWDAKRLQDVARDIVGVVGEREARVVDIGCANGGLLGELKALGFSNLLGVDPSAACAANAQRLYGIKAFKGSIREMPADLGKADLVILSHVLEHVADLQATLRDLIPFLDEGGRFYIEVPDAARYREYLVAPFQDFNTEHINHFSLSALRNLFGRHFFTAESSGQKNIESSPGCPYPAAHSFFRRSASAKIGRGSTYEVDNSVRANLVDYIAASNRKLAKIERQLAVVCADGQPLMVWGTGQLTMKLLAETSLRKARILAFIDGNPINQGKKLIDVPILAPEEVTDRSIPILLATMLHQKAIEHTIRGKLQLPNAIIALDG